MRVVAGLLIAAGFLAALFYVTAAETSYECNVCIRYNGAENCATVSGPDEEQAMMQAVSTACAQISDGVTAGMECNRTRPNSARCTSG